MNSRHSVANVILKCFSHIYADRESLIKEALDLAGQIAKKSPIAIAGTKHNLNYSRDHSVLESLDYMVSLPNITCKSMKRF